MNIKHIAITTLLTGSALLACTQAMADSDLTYDNGYNVKLCTQDSSHYYTLWTEDSSGNQSKIYRSDSTLGICAKECQKNDYCPYDIPDNTQKIILYYTAGDTNETLDFDPDTDNGKTIECDNYGSVTCEFL